MILHKEWLSSHFEVFTQLSSKLFVKKRGETSVDLVERLSFAIRLPDGYANA